MARLDSPQALVEAALAAATTDGTIVIVTDRSEANLRWAGSSLTTNGESEVTLAWQDKETGVWLRARPDFLPHKRRIIPDLKTAADGAPRAFGRAIANFGYHQSAALYSDGIKAIFGHLPTHWVHVVMEKEPPHVVSLYELPGEDIERGRWLNRKAIRLFAECLSTGRWPGYSDEPSQIGLPGWERKRLDDDASLTAAAWSEAA